MRRLGMAVGMVLLSGLQASAATVSFGAVDSGWYRSYGDLDSKFFPGNLNYFAGEFPSAGGGLEYRNYFVFNLAGLSGTAVNAYLTIPNRQASGSNTGAPFAYDLYDVSTSAGVLAVANPGVGGSIFADLGTGTTYGGVTIPLNATNPVFIALNGAALAAINAGGMFAIGGDVTSGGTGDHYLFYDYPAGSAPTLTVDTLPREAATVPEPGTAAFAVGGLGLLFAAYRRRKQ